MRNQEPLGVGLVEEMDCQMIQVLHTFPFELFMVSIMKGMGVLKGTYSQ